MAWSDLKADLQKQDKLPTIFKKSADDIAFEAITSDEIEPPIIVKAYGKDNRTEHQLLLFDLHLQDVSALLDRIIAFRRQPIQRDDANKTQWWVPDRHRVVGPGTSSNTLM
jgi:hypothetical protein